MLLQRPTDAVPSFVEQANGDGGWYVVGEGWKIPLHDYSGIRWMNERTVGRLANFLGYSVARPSAGGTDDVWALSHNGGMEAVSTTEKFSSTHRVIARWCPTKSYLRGMDLIWMLLKQCQKKKRNWKAIIGIGNSWWLLTSLLVI